MRGEAPSGAFAWRLSRTQGAPPDVFERRSFRMCRGARGRCGISGAADPSAGHSLGLVRKNWTYGTPQWISTCSPGCNPA